MAKDKSKFWKVKWILLYAIFVLFCIFLLVSTIVFWDNCLAKIVVIIYESLIILFAISFPIAMQYWRKDSKKMPKFDT